MPRIRPTRVLRTQFLLQLAVMALERWDRLDEAEQARFRTLARQSGDAKTPLTKPEDKELRQLWRKLDARTLVAEAAKLVTRGDRSGGSTDGGG